MPRPTGAVAGARPNDALRYASISAVGQFAGMDEEVLNLVIANGFELARTGTSTICARLLFGTDQPRVGAVACGRAAVPPAGVALQDLTSPAVSARTRPVHAGPCQRPDGGQVASVSSPGATCTTSHAPTRYGPATRSTFRRCSSRMNVMGGDPVPRSRRAAIRPESIEGKGRAAAAPGPGVRPCHGCATDRCAQPRAPQVDSRPGVRWKRGP